MLRDIRRSEIQCCSLYYVQGADAGARKSADHASYASAAG